MGKIVELRFIDTETGEVTEGVSRYIEETDSISSYGIVKNTKRKTENFSLELKDFNSKLGGFVMMAYVKNEVLFSNIKGLKAEDITKLVYLATFIDYNNKETESILVNKTATNEKTPMTLNQASNKLKFSSTKKGRAWIREMEKLELLHIKEDNIVMSKKYFIKGRIDKTKIDKEAGFSRLYINTIRQLYEENSFRKHKHISYIYKLIPFMHINTNIICHNPEEADSSKMKRIFMYEIAKILGIEGTQQNVNKLFNELKKIKITYKGEELYPFTSIIANSKNIQDCFWVANPCFIYKGSNFKEVSSILSSHFFSKDLNKMR